MDEVQKVKLEAAVTALRRELYGMEFALNVSADGITFHHFKYLDGALNQVLDAMFEVEAVMEGWDKN